MSTAENLSKFPEITGIDLETIIGQGATGIVYKGQEKDKTVAVKVYNSDSLAEDKERFLVETFAALRVTHENLLEQFSVGQTDSGELFISSEFVDGSPLSEGVTAKKRPIDVVIKTAISVSKALSRLHKANLIHRDIKPENILLSNDGIVKLIDLGLAEEIGNSALTEFVGTPFFAPPEQLGVIKMPMDQRSDLFSLGVSMFQLVTSELPFEGPDIGSLVKQHSRGELRSELLDSLGEENSKLRDIILKLLEQDPDDRYQSAEELLQALSVLPNVDEKLGTGDIFISDLAGRDAETSGLVSAIEETRQVYRSKLIAVAGAEGLGKTAIAKYAVDKFRAKGSVVIEVGVDVNSPILSVIEKLAKLSDSEKLKEVLLGARPQLGQVLFSLYKEYEIEAESQGKGTSIDERALAVSQVVSELVKSLEKHTIILIDSNEYDALTSRFLALFERDGLSLCILSTFFSVPSEVRTNKTLFELDIYPLEDAFISKFVSLYFGGREVKEFDVKQVKDLTECNPKILVQFLEAMLRKGYINLNYSQISLNESKIPEINIKGESDGAVTSRFSEATAKARELLIGVLVLEKASYSEILIEFLGLNREDYESYLEEALNSGLLKVTGEKVQFRFDSHREVLFSHLLQEDWTELYFKASKVVSLDKFSKFSREIDYSLYFLNGRPEEIPEISVKYLSLGGRNALEGYSFEKSIKCFEKANDIAETISVSNEEKLRLLEGLGRAYDGCGKVGVATEVYRKALLLSESVETEIELRSLILDSLITDMKGEEAFEEFLIIIKHLGQPYPKSKFAGLLSVLSYLLKMLFVKSVPRSEDQRNRYQMLSKYYSYAGYFAGYFGRKDLLLKLSIRQFYVSKRFHDSTEKALAFANLAYVFAALGKFEKMDNYFDQALKMADKLNVVWLKGYINAHMSMAYHMAGQVKRGYQTAEKALLGEDWQLPADYFRMVADLCTNFWQRGYPNVVVKWARPAIEMAENLGLLNRVVLPRIFSYSNYNRLDMRKESMDDLTRAKEIMSEQKVDTFVRIVAISAQLDGYAAAGIEDEEAEALIKEFYEEVGVNSVSFYNTHVFVHMAMYYMRVCEKNPSEENLNKYKFALDNLKKVYRHPTHKSNYYAMLAGYLRLSGKITEVPEVLKKGREIAKQVENEWAKIQFDLEEARIAKSYGDVSDAQAFGTLAFNRAQAVGLYSISKKIGSELNIKMLKAVDLGQSTMKSSSHGSSVGMFSAKKQTEIMTKVGLMATGSIKLQDQVDAALDSVIDIMGAERGFLFLCDEGSDELKLMGARDSAGNPIDSLGGYSGSIIREVFDTREPVILMADDHKQVDLSNSIVTLGLKSIMAVPLILKDKILGVAYVDSSIAKGIFANEDISIFLSIINHVSVAIEIARAAELETEKVRLEKEAELTGSVQNMFFPKESSVTNKLAKMDAFFRPAEQCSGDWWTHFEVNGKLYGLVADVTGHGTPSAMVTSSIATSIRSYLSRSREKFNEEEMIKEVSTVVNELFNQNFLSTMCIVGFAEDCFEVWFCGAPPIFCIYEDKINSVSQQSNLIGAETVNIGKVTVDKDCKALIVMSDGVYEQELDNGRELGMRALARMMKKIESKNSTEFHEKLLALLEEKWPNRALDDDATILTCSFL